MSSISLIRAYMKRHGLSQQEFADQLGVSQGMVWQWLNGYRPISAERAKKIEYATGGVIKRRELRPDVFAP